MKQKKYFEGKTLSQALKSIEKNLSKLLEEKINMKKTINGRWTAQSIKKLDKQIEQKL